MAGSRMEKLSTIFKRYSGLIKSGVALKENRPVWYDVYRSFPPRVEPLAIRSEPKVMVRNIFYPEDILRSRYNRAYGDFANVHNFVDISTGSSSVDSPSKPPFTDTKICT